MEDKTGEHPLCLRDRSHARGGDANVSDAHGDDSGAQTAKRRRAEDAEVTGGRCKLCVQVLLLVRCVHMASVHNVRKSVCSGCRSV